MVPRVQGLWLELLMLCCTMHTERQDVVLAATVPAVSFTCVKETLSKLSADSRAPAGNLARLHDSDVFHGLGRASINQVL